MYIRIGLPGYVPCSKCRRPFMHDETFHIVINKDEPDINLKPTDPLLNGADWIANITYHKRNVDSMIFLCKNCKNEIFDFLNVSPIDFGFKGEA